MGKEGSGVVGAVDNLLGSDAFSGVMCGGAGRARGSLPGGTFNLER